MADDEDAPLQNVVDAVHPPADGLIVGARVEHEVQLVVTRNCSR